MRITQRQVRFGLQIFAFIGVVLLAIFQIAQYPNIGVVIAYGFGIISTSVLLYADWRGWKYVPPVLMVIAVVMSAVGSPQTVMSREAVLGFLIAPVVASIIGRPSWVLVAGVLTPLLFLARSAGQNLDTDPSLYVLYFMVVGGMFLSRMVIESALGDVREHADRAADALAQAEQRSHELGAANNQMGAQIDEQRRLLELVATLETPAVTLAEGVLLAPLVGHLDARRAEQLIARLLEDAHLRRASLVILDIAGVTSVDTQVARALLDAAQALRLLGCSVAISGISAEVAVTLTNLGISLSGVRTVRSPQEALEFHQEIMTGGRMPG